MDEYLEEENYWGYGDSYLDGRGYRKKGTRPMAVLDTEFSKSVLSEEEEFYIDEFGVKRRKKGITELQDINVEEVSFVDSPVVRKKFMIIKGDDKEMDEEKELKGWEDVSEKELSVIKETISILNKYDLVDDLKRTKETLTKYFGEEVKKYNERCEWGTVQNQLYGYTEDDLDFIEENIEVEKRDPNDKWPSLSGQFARNQRRLEKQFEECELDSRLV